MNILFLISIGLSCYLFWMLVVVGIHIGKNFLDRSSHPDTEGNVFKRFVLLWSLLQVFNTWYLFFYYGQVT